MDVVDYLNYVLLNLPKGSRRVFLALLPILGQRYGAWNLPKGSRRTLLDKIKARDGDYVRAESP